MSTLRRAVAIAGLSVLTIAGFLALAVQPAGAIGNTFYVGGPAAADNSTCGGPGTSPAPNPDHPCLTIAYAFTVRAGTSDTINVRPGTYTMTTAAAANPPAVSPPNSTNRLNVTKTVTIQRDPVAVGTVTLDGGNVAIANSSVILVNNAAAVLTLKDVTVARGNGGLISSGAGLFVAAGGAILDNVILDANKSPAGFGGGVFVNAGTALTMNGGSVTNNSAANGGGAIVAGTSPTLAAGIATFTGVTFSANTALGAAVAAGGNGGAIYSSGVTTVNNGTFTSNSVLQSTNANARRGYGGSIFSGPTDALDQPTFALNGGTFSGTFQPNVLNAHASFGGAIANVGLIGSAAAGTLPSSLTGGPVNITGAIAFEGGGIFNSGTANLVGGTITGSKANPFLNIITSGSGGGIFNLGTLTLGSMTLSNNEAKSEANTFATGLGGGLFNNTPGTVTASGVTISGNKAIGVPVVSGTAATVSALGGGVFNGGTATIQTGSLVASNTATGGAGAATGIGGGIYSQSTLNVANSTIRDNSATAGAASASGLGGGLFTGAAGITATLNNVTVQNNDAIGGAGVDANGLGNTGFGGGIYNSGTLNAQSTLIDLNEATAGAANSTGQGGGLYNSGTANLSQSTLLTNKAIAGPGALLGFGLSGLGGGAANSGTINLTQGTFSANQAVGSAQAFTGLGGGIYSSGTVNANGGGHLDGNTATAGAGSLTGLGGGLFNSGTYTGTGLVSWNSAVGSTALATGLGGGVYNAATFTLNAAGITDNSAVGTTGQATGLGGGVYNAGTAATTTVTDSALSGNVASGTATLQTGWGGAIYNGTSTANTVNKVVLDQVSVHHNTADAGSAIFSLATGTGATAQTSISRSTIAENDTTTSFGTVVSSTGGATSIAESTVAANQSPVFAGANPLVGALWSGSGGTISVSGSIVSGNTGGNQGNCGGPIADGGYNLTDPADTGCGFTVVENDVLADPQLGPLQSNGGGTVLSMEPSSTSPALDEIPEDTATGETDAVSGDAIVLCTGADDQRGFPRPAGVLCDIGAVERTQDAPVITAGPTEGTFTIGVAGELDGYIATGSPTPTFSSPDLPSGLSIVSTGPGTAKIAGTPAAGTSGVHTVHVVATNEAGTDELEVTLTIREVPTVTAPATIRFIVGGPANSGEITSTGFPTPTITIVGTLPPGIDFTPGDPGEGTIGGTATGPVGTFQVTVKATNAAGSAEQVVTIEVVPPLTITTTSLPDGGVGVPYDASVVAVGGEPPYSFAVIGSLPAGLDIDAETGAITGVPTGPPGTSSFTVEVTDSADDPQVETKELSITIGAGATTIEADTVLIQRNPLGLRIGTVSATLRDGSGDPIPGQTVQFKAGPALVCTTVTNANGVATCQLSVVNTLLVILALRVTAVFPGSPSYLPSSDYGLLL